MKPPFDEITRAWREDVSSRADDEAWVRRARGESPPEERAELEARAKTNEEDALLLHASRPLGGAELDALVARAHAGATARPSEQAGGAQARSEGPAPRGVVLRGPRSRWPAAVIASSMIVAAAAAWVLMVRAPGVETTLPAYALRIEGVDAELRGTTPAPSAERRVVSPGARLRLVFQPEAPVDTPVAAVAYVQRGADVRSVPVPVRVSASGTATLEGTREELFGGEAGAVNVLLFVGPQKLLPDARSASAAPTTEAVRRAVVPLDLR